MPNLFFTFMYVVAALLTGWAIGARWSHTLTTGWAIFIATIFITLHDVIYTFILMTAFSMAVRSNPAKK